MPAGFASIRAALKTVLLTITDFSGRVDDYHNGDLQGYPACTFDVSDNSNDFLTNRENMRTITFQIVIYQEMYQLGLEQATATLDAVVDKVIAALEDNFSLNNAVDWCDPVTIGRRVQFTTPNGAVIGQELSIKTNSAVSLNF